jgi:enoyl-CoA hydratase
MPVDLRIRDHVAVLTLDRPEVLNAMDRNLLDDLEKAIGEVEANDGIRALVVTGAGRAFCSGSDIRELDGISADEAERIVSREARLCRRLHDLAIPTVAAIHGHALGGGFALALYLDLRVAAESARLGCPQIRLGWNTPYGTSLLTRLAGPGRARELLFRGHLIDAREAHRIGLVDRVVPDGSFLEEALSICREIAGHAPTAIRTLKALLGRGEAAGLAEDDEAGCRAFRACFDTEEARAGIRGFLERRSRRSP